MALTQGFPALFNPGFGLQDGTTLNGVVSAASSYMAGITAHSGGTQPLGFQLVAAQNQIDVVAADNDSVRLPPASPGRSCSVNNNGAHTLAVYGTGTDTIAAQGSTAQQPVATGVTQLTGVATTYTCWVAGQWKQGGVS